MKNENQNQGFRNTTFIYQPVNKLHLLIVLAYTSYKSIFVGIV